MAPCSLVLLLLLSAVRVRGKAQCVEQVETSLRLRVTSQTNATGHRNVHADLVSLYYGAMNGTGLDVLHSGGRCDDMQFRRLSTAVNAWGSVATPRFAPSDYELFPGVGRYKLHMDKKTWTDAEMTCQNEGGHLILVNSEAEADVVRTIYARKNPVIGSGVWAGYHSLFKPGHFVTVFGDTLDRAGYLKWASGQPLSGKHCGDTYQDGLLYSWTCGDAVPFLCEISL